MDVRSDIFPGTPDGFHPRDVSVRLARPDERIRWDRLMDQHHYLGFNLKKAVEAWYRPILGGIFASRL